MLAGELIELAKDIMNKCCELQTVELKAAEKGCPHKLYDTMSSFSNQQNGGIIIFGIKEDEHYNVCGVYDAQDLQVKVMEQANQMSPIVRPLFTIAELDDKLIVSAEIAECDVFDKPCFYRGAGRMRGSYIRVGDADLPMTEYEIYSYETFRKKLNDELRTFERADTNAFDHAALDSYYLKVKQMKTNLSNLPEEQILQLQGIIDDRKPTLAGLMLFGIYPQAFTPQLCITAVVVPGTEIGETGYDGERFIDNKRIEGTIPQMLEEVLAFVRRNTKNKTIIDENGIRNDKSEYPMKAIRELVLNALIHRDYSIHTDSSPIRIMIFRDRLEIENPGGLYGRLTLDSLGKVGADTRNPYIAGALELLINTENRFSGIPTVILEMKKAGLMPPKFEDMRGAFKVTLFNDTNEKKGIMDNNTDNLETLILEYCNIPRSRIELAKQFNFDAPSYMINKYIKPLIDDGKLKMTLPQTPKSKNQRYITVANK